MPACTGHNLLLDDNKFTSSYYTIPDNTENTISFSIFKWMQAIDDGTDWKYMDS